VFENRVIDNTSGVEDITQRGALYILSGW